MSYTTAVIGAATFDLSGLPRDYFITADCRDVTWVQTVFQGLGLQSLLAASLQLEEARHVIVHSTGHQAIVLKQKYGYVALLLNSADMPLSEEFIDWAREFDTATLAADPRFNEV